MSINTKAALISIGICTILVIFTTFLTYGCKQQSQQDEVTAVKPSPKIVDYIPYGISVQVIDGCQYICARGGDGVSIIHKQNCNNHLQ